MSAESTTITQAYRYDLRLTPAQEERLLSFTGAARFAFNWGLGLVKERLNRRERGEQVSVPWSYHSLYTEWRKGRDQAAPWRREVPYTAFLTGLEGLRPRIAGFQPSAQSWSPSWVSALSREGEGKGTDLLHAR